MTRSRPVCTPARVCSFHTWLKSCLTSDQITKFIFKNICLALPVYAARWTLHVHRCTLCGGHCTCSDVRCAVDTARAAMYAVRWTLHVQRCTLCGGHCTCSDVRCAVDTARAAMYAVRWTLHVQRCTLCGGHYTCSNVRCAVDTAIL